LRKGRYHEVRRVLSRGRTLLGKKSGTSYSGKKGKGDALFVPSFERCRQERKGGKWTNRRKKRYEVGGKTRIKMHVEEEERFPHT